MRTTNTINRRAKLIDWLDPLATTSCIKIRHDSQAAAQRHIARLRQVNNAGLVPYECPVCHSWHVGHHKDRAR